jgi:hypothetical protein
MKRRSHGRRITAMSAAAWLAVLCLTALVGCAGGSGSSGFDAIENAAIDQALDEQRCVESGGLVICPADTAVSAPTPLATATPTPTASPTTAAPATDTPPIATPATEAARTATPTPTSTRLSQATVTATPAGVRIDVGLDTAGPVDCMVVDGSCEFSFAFTAVGFPPVTSFLVAARPAAPENQWEISVPVPADQEGDRSFNALIAVPATGAEETILVQVAVLAQSGPFDSVPASVDSLGETSAEFAFVTPEIELRPVR